MNMPAMEALRYKLPFIWKNGNEKNVEIRTITCSFGSIAAAAVFASEILNFLLFTFEHFTSTK